MLYLDTSALVKLIRPELESAALTAWLNARAGEAAVTSALTEVELPRAIRRSAPGQLAAVSPVLARLARFEIDAAVRATAAAYTDPDLHSLDAIHLATADQLRAAGKTISSFVTYDSRLARAAQAAGFTPIAPASGP
jgi:predicted nucleic acid-binding protein